MTEESNTKGDNTTTVVGESIMIVGDISGQGDITINGTVEGEINFRENDVLVGENGTVNANVTARNISVEGDVRGELRATEQISIRKSGRVNGDIRAPRVVLDDGCQFKGSIDMEEVKSADSRNPKLALAGSKSGPALKKKPGSK